ncbi:MAG: hypothetical protein CSA62_01720 [Planctomycetota bacterium]|nr:MAG: hypothetical protein CSA62_01720 [Planctomycetota bacterium]
MAIYHEYWAEGIPPEIRAISERAIDLDAEKTQCPACGAEFAPEETVGEGQLRCPDCGLRYA